MLYFKLPYTDENIKKQFKDLAKILHPDKKGGSAVKFKQMIQEKETILNFLKLHNKEPIKKEKKILIKKNTYIQIVRIDPEELINKILDRLL